jgi:glycogen debranching enzyme
MVRPDKQFFERLPTPPVVGLLPPSLALRKVTSKDKKAVYASADTLYKGAVFGRDSCVMAEDLLERRSDQATNILRTLASLQGTADDDLSEEAPGKIVHEYRNTRIDGRRIDQVSLRIFERLSTQWGGNDTEMAYYGSCDATPHYLRTLGRFCAQKSRDLQHITVRSYQTGEQFSLQQSAERATAWLIGQLDHSRSGLLEWQRRNPLGIKNQVWKDSDEFYIHQDGEMANHDAPISSIEVQGLAYDALLFAAEYGWGERAECLRRAYALRDRTIELLWDDSRRYFNLGTDFDPVSDELRVITTPSANAGSLLNSRFFDDLPPDERSRLVSGVVDRIFENDFLTNAGVRSRSLLAADLIPFWDYHGSFVTWPKETYDIAKGLRLQRLPSLAEQLENRLINAILKQGHDLEFFYVDKYGRVLSKAPKSKRQKQTEVLLIDATNNAEAGHGWTITARYNITAQRIERRVKGARKPQQETWLANLEQQVLSRIPKIRPILNPFTLSAHMPTTYYGLRDEPDISPRTGT